MLLGFRFCIAAVYVGICCLLLAATVTGERIGTTDVLLNSYTEQGELAQIAYAGRLVDRTSPAVGFTLNDGKTGYIIRCKPKSSLLLARSVSTIEQFYCFSVCVAGLESDCARFKQECVNVLETELFTFGEPPSIEKLSSKLSTFVTRGLYQEKKGAFARPLAVSAIVASLSEIDSDVDVDLDLDSTELSEGDESDKGDEKIRSGGGRVVRMRLLHSSGAVLECANGGMACTGSITQDAEGISAIEALVLDFLDSAGSATETNNDNIGVAKMKEKGRDVARRVSKVLLAHMRRRLDLDDTKVEIEGEEEDIIKSRGEGPDMGPEAEEMWEWEVCELRAADEMVTTFGPCTSVRDCFEGEGGGKRAQVR